MSGCAEAHRLQRLAAVFREDHFAADGAQQQREHFAVFQDVIHDERAHGASLREPS